MADLLSPLLPLLKEIIFIIQSEKFGVENQDTFDYDKSNIRGKMKHVDPGTFCIHLKQLTLQCTFIMHFDHPLPFIKPNQNWGKLIPPLELNNPVSSSATLEGNY